MGRVATEYRLLSAAPASGYPREPVLHIAVGKRRTLVTLPLTRDEALRTAIRLIEIVQRAYRDDPAITESEGST